jgi:uncharacterized repeat protein (TIGR02543 family)
MPESKYTLSGYDFAGWTTDTEHFEKEFDTYSKVAMTELVPYAQGNTITLYAHWNDADFPASPSDFFVEKIERTSVSLSWKSASDNDLVYTRLSYKKKDDTVSTFIDFKAEDILYDENGNILSTEYTIENLDEGKTYSFTVTSYDVAGNSNEYNADCTKLVVPRSSVKYVPSLRFQQTSPSQLLVTWEKPSVVEFPFIEKISLFIDGNEKSSYTAQNSIGECYSENSFTVDITSLTLYEIQLKIEEKTDESGRSNPSETDLYEYYSEPERYEFDFDPVTISGEKKVYWKYADKLGFSLTMTDPQDSRVGLYAECLEIDENGNGDEKNILISPLEYKDEEKLYICNELESAKNYRVKIFVGADETINGKKYVSYSRFDEKTIDCSTVEFRGAGIGYFCYSSGKYYPELQKTGVVLAIVADVNQFNEPVLLLGLKDLDSQVSGLNEAERKLAGKLDGNFIWRIPLKSDIEAIFNNENKEKIMASLLAADGKEFAASEIDQNGISSGRYITATKSGQNEMYVFEIDGELCGEPFTVQSENSGSEFRIRPVVRF